MGHSLCRQDSSVAPYKTIMHGNTKYVAADKIITHIIKANCTFNVIKDDIWLLEKCF